MGDLRDLLRQPPPFVRPEPFSVVLRRSLEDLVSSFEDQLGLNLYRENKRADGFRMHDTRKLDPTCGHGPPFDSSTTPHLHFAEMLGVEFSDIIDSPREAYLCEIAIEIDEGDYIVSPRVNLEDDDFAERLSRQVRARVFPRNAYFMGDRRFRAFWWMMIEGLQRD